MDEANQRLQQIPITAQARVLCGAVTLARQGAVKAVKRQFAARGIKLHSVTHREIVAAAEYYLSDHPELITEAKPTIERWTLEGVLGKRAQRALAASRECSQSPTISNTSAA
jgi:hypothetical protein